MTKNISLRCPLCTFDAVDVLETLRQEAINEAYKRFYDIENAVSCSLTLLRCNHCKLRFFSPPEAGGEDLYERLQTHDWYYMAEKWEYAEAMKFIDSKDTVLDVGSGRAAFANYVGKDRYTGLEFNLRAIQRAKEAGILLIKEPIEAHAAQGHSYDAVVSFQVLEHVVNPATFIRGCIDCLKNNGTLILAVPAADGFAGEAVNDILNLPPHHVTQWKDVVFKNIALMFGLELLELRHEPIADYHVEVAKKIQYEARIRRVLGLPARILDRSWLARLISRTAVILTRVFPSAPAMGNGHTVLAVYRKYK